MLVELAAANAAFAIIKQTVENGMDVARAGKAIADFTNAKDSLQRKSSKKGNRSDLEEFLALEELKRKEEELREAMQLFGRGGMYNDYVKFCVEARKERQRVQQEHEAKMEAYFEWAFIVFMVLFLVIGLGVLVWALMPASP